MNAQEIAKETEEGEMLTRDEHLKRHKELHKALDELLADFIQHNHPASLFNTKVIDLLTWTFEQTLDPTPAAHDE